MAAPTKARARERLRGGGGKSFAGLPLPRERLAKRLQVFTRSQIADLCASIGIDRNIGNRARAARDVNASAYLALCAASGIDAVTGNPCTEKHPPGEVLWWFLGAGFYLERIRQGLDLRKAAKACGISLTTAARINAGDPVGTESFLKVCRFMGVPPEGYASGVSVQCFTCVPGVEQTNRGGA